MPFRCTPSIYLIFYKPSQAIMFPINNNYIVVLWFFGHHPKFKKPIFPSNSESSESQ